MEQKLSIGICILFFEKAAQTIECVQSFLASGVPIYILNNSSSPESTQILKNFCQNYPQVKIFDSPENLGVSKGRNFLINNTTEEWLFFVDNDITIKEGDWLEKIGKHITEYPDTEVFIPRLFNVHEKSYSEFKPFVLENKLVQRNEKYQGDIINMFPGGASIINRCLFVRLGFYEECMFVGFEDFEFAIRSMVSGNPIRAKIIDDIELVHDHRIAISENDKTSARVRYDIKKLKASQDFIAKKYKLHMDYGWKYWVKNRLSYFVDGKSKKTLTLFERAVIKLKNMFEG